MGFTKKQEESISLLKTDDDNNYGSLNGKSWKEKESKVRKLKKGGIMAMLTYATRLDRILIAIGIFFSLLTGMCLPFLGLIFGQMTDVFLRVSVAGFVPESDMSQFSLNGSDAVPKSISTNETTNVLVVTSSKVVYQVLYTISEIFVANYTEDIDYWSENGTVYQPITVEEYEASVNGFTILYLLVGTAMFLTSFVQTCCFELVAERSVFRLRKVFFSQVLRQDISWFDSRDQGNLTNTLTDDLERLREGFGCKVTMCTQYAATFLSGLLVGFIVNVRLTAAIICVGPIFIGVSAYVAKIVATGAVREQEKYASAGAVAEEVLSNIKTVNAFSGQTIAVKKYEAELLEGRKLALKKYFRFALCLSITMLLTYFTYSLGFYYGTYLISIGLCTPGSVFTVFFSVMAGTFSIGNALPYINQVGIAIGVMRSITEIIDRVPKTDPYSDSGTKLSQVKGHIQFNNVSFTYPTRPNVKILKSFNMDITPGKTVALVGSSGAGKSTIIGLLLRYYEPSSGDVMVDDVPISNLNLNWYRKQIGLVSQEPVLFGVSIADNISYGRENVNLLQIADAAKLANAHDFIMKLPQGYDTMVGDTGSQLSGGQKQRIAIARALVRDPKILLLDEATSALDAQSEGIVQAALENAMQGRTTIIVAHRLSTVMNADMIYVMKEGEVFEKGTHEELMKNESLYYSLVMAQMKLKPDSDEDGDSSSLGGDTDSLILGNESSDERDPVGVKTDEDPFTRISGEEKEPTASLPFEQEGDSNLQEKSQSAHSSREKTEGGSRVLERTVSVEKLNVDNDDDEYETVVTIVRETREILFADDGEEDDSSNLPRRRSSRKSKDLGTQEMSVRRRSMSRRKSKYDDEKSDAPAIQKESMLRDIGIKDIIYLQKPEWCILFCGILGCLGTGTVTPIFAVFYGEIFSAYTLQGEQLSYVAQILTIMFVLLGFYSALATWFQVKCMSYSSELLVLRMRKMAFENILRQPVSWFDNETSSPGILVTKLARDAPLVKASGGMRLGQVLAACVTLITALIIAFISGWQLALVLAICMPVIMISTHQQHVMLKRNQLRDTALMEAAGRVSSESVRNIRTVQALAQETRFTEMYSKTLETPYEEGKKQAFVYSLIYGFTQAVMFYMYACAFKAGGYFVEMGIMTSSSMYRVFFALAFCAQSVGTAFSYLQDFAKAKHASRLLYFLVKRQSEVDSSSPYGAKPEISGKVEFRNVNFSYPTRPDVKVLQGLTLSVEPGKTLALVGESGCGKSTVIALLERFYETSKGVIKVDNFDIRTMNVAHLRASMGLVTQEPILFDTTIRDNIAYGASATNPGEIPFSDVIAAAKIANVHNFVVALPQGYDTMVGERGIQLSGGQKQRVAIARALIRNPKILLLDEATSALDTESEKIVQEALDRAREGRTCITIAHRLSTIQNADTICVIHRGKVIEQGTHQQLQELQGHYYNLTQRQCI